MKIQIEFRKDWNYCFTNQTYQGQVAQLLHPCSTEHTFVLRNT